MSIYTRAHLIELLGDAVWSSAVIDRDRFDIDAAADAILAGHVTPDDNGGAIPPDDIAGQLAFGAIVSDGSWWR